MRIFMKKSFKASLIIFIIGFIITVTALALGGRFESLPSRNTLANFSQSYTNVESLNIDLNAAQIEINTGDEFKVEASDISKDTFKAYVDNGVLYVQDKSKFNFQFLNNNQPKVTIYLPENFNPQNMKINIGAGELISEKLAANIIDINLGAGNLQISKLETNEINIDNGVGNVELSGAINTNAYIKCGIGNVKLDLKGNEKDYNYNLNAGIGEITLNDQNFAGLGNKVIDNSSENKKFKIDCGIGKLNLNINE